MSRSWWLLVLGVIVAAAAILAISLGVNSNEEAIDTRVTRDDLLRVVAADRRDKRRACREVNKRFGRLAQIIAGNRPSAQTTEYYATRPAELAKAQRDFDKTLDALRPRHCLKAYPVPTPREIDRISEGKAPRAATSPPKREREVAAEVARRVDPVVRPKPRAPPKRQVQSEPASPQPEIPPPAPPAPSPAEPVPPPATPPTQHPQVPAPVCERLPDLPVC